MDSVSGQQLVQATESILIDEIPERIGQIMRRSLADKLTPHGDPEHPRYRLSANIHGIYNSEQAVRKDNLATRYLMTMSVRYALYTYPENKRLMSDSLSGRSAYDVQRSPYATDVAEKITKERLAKIMGNNIALRVAAFLKAETKPETKEIPEETPVVEDVGKGLAEETAMVPEKTDEPSEKETDATGETEAVREP